MEDTIWDTTEVEVDEFDKVVLASLRIPHGYWYLATVYSKHPHGIEAAFVDAAKAAAECVRAGVSVFSPIAHTHPVAIHGGIDPMSHDIWMPVDQPMMDQAHGLLVVMMDGWRDSFGINKEIEEFSVMGKPVIYLGKEVVGL